MDSEVEITFAEPEQRYQALYNGSANLATAKRLPRSKQDKRGSRKHELASVENIPNLENCISYFRKSNEPIRNVLAEVRNKRAKSLDRSRCTHRNRIVDEKLSQSHCHKTDKNRVVNKNLTTDSNVSGPSFEDTEFGINCNGPSTVQSKTCCKSHSSNCPRNPENLAVAHEYHKKNALLALQANLSKEALSKKSQLKPLILNNEFDGNSKQKSKLNEADIPSSEKETARRIRERSLSNLRRSKTVVSNHLNYSGTSDIHKELLSKNCKNLTSGISQVKFSNLENATSTIVNGREKENNLSYSARKRERSPANTKVLTAVRSSRSRTRIKHSTFNSDAHQTRELKPDTNIQRALTTIDKNIQKQRKSESTTRYAIPREIRPVRSKSIVGAFSRKKLEVRNNDETQRKNDKVVDPLDISSEHIYDTIGSCGCHKYAIDRIESILISPRAITDTNATNYDIPKPTRPITSNCFKATSIKKDVVRQENITKYDNKTYEIRFSKNEKNCTLDISADKHNSDLIGHVKNDVSDTESTATYASIILPADVPIVNKLQIENESSRHLYSPKKLRTLDIKEEKRKTPDIVKCSREPLTRKLKQNTNGPYPQSFVCQCSPANFFAQSKSSSENESELYHGLSPPSTVIHVPLNNVNGKKTSGQNVYPNLVNGPVTDIASTASVSPSPEEEIYSVVNEWPSDDFRAKMTDMLRSGNNIPSTHELSEYKVDIFRNKFIDDSIGVPPPTNPMITQYGPDETLDVPMSSRNETTRKTPQVTVCKSLDELRSLVSSDLSAHVYVYQGNGEDVPLQHSIPRQVTFYSKLYVTNSTLVKLILTILFLYDDNVNTDYA